MSLEDPLIIPPSAIDGPALLSTWSSMIHPQCTLLGASLFGHLFLRRPTGEVDMMDLVSGELKEIATCIEEFEWDLKQPERREEWLMQSLAQAALAMGLAPGPGECLAFRTPPMLNGSIKPDNLLRWDFLSYHRGLAKLWPQIRDLPAGTRIVIKEPE